MDEQKQIEELSEFFYRVDRTTYRGGPIRVANYDALALALYDAGYRKQSEGEWIDRYNGKYANSLYVCSLCDERAPLYIKADELGNEQIVQMVSQFCPNCGSHMKGV